MSRKLLIILLAVGTSVQATASEIALLGLFEQTTPFLVDSTSNADFTPGNGYGAGIQLTAALTRRIELELGASFNHRLWSDSQSGALLMPAVDLPAGLRFRPWRFVALEAGAYYSSINTGPRVDYVSSRDYGAFAGLQLMIPMSALASLLLGGRYLYGLCNVSTVGGELRFRVPEALAGLQFSLSRGAR